MSLKLAVLKNATSGDTTFYTGDDERDVQHLSNCTLLCRRTFDGLDNVEIRVVEDPQAEFYTRFAMNIPSAIKGKIIRPLLGKMCR